MGALHRSWPFACALLLVFTLTYGVVWGWSRAHRLAGICALAVTATVAHLGRGERHQG